VVRQRPAKPRTAVRVRSSPLVALLLLLAVAACATSDTGGLDAQHLVPQLSDLPAGYDAVPAESFPVSLETVLADQWSAGIRPTIRRERLSGYQASFASPTTQRIECSAALYRSTEGAAKVFAFRLGRFTDFVSASGGEPIQVERLGAQTRAYRYRLGEQHGLLVTWRSRRVLSLCGAVRGDLPDLSTVLVVARAQQRRIASFGR
jgi:hypothetical protein